MFNKLRSFGEWYDVDSALDDSVSFYSKRKVAFDRGQTGPFIEFSRKQPEQISDQLFHLDDKLKEYHASAMKGVESIVDVKTELTKLKPLNEDFRAKKKQTAHLNDVAAKSKAAAEKAKQKMEAAKAKDPEGPDAVRTTNSYNLAESNSQQDASNAEKRQKDFDRETIEYKKQFLTTVLDSLSLLASSRITACRSQVATGESIESLGDQIPDFTDTGIDNLQSQLQSIHNDDIN